MSHQRSQQHRKINISRQFEDDNTMSVSWRHLYVNVNRLIWGLIFIVYSANVYLYFTPISVTRDSGQCPPIVKVTPVSQSLSPIDNTAKTRPTLAEVRCSPRIPCEYPEVTDLRIIVLTYARHTSLQKILLSLNDLQLDGDSAILEIWIDRGKDGGVDEKTVQTAHAFNWEKGPTRVHVHSEHVGIYGQWIDTWRPPVNTTEVALILEDDLGISKYAYRWLKSVHKHFKDRKDIGGYTLQSENVNKANGGGPIIAPKGHVVFLYKLLGSWGFAPHPGTWRAFQDWYHSKAKDKSFHPYVEHLVMTTWYKNFEKQHKEDSMWTMWYIYYVNEQGLYTVYNNLKDSVHSGANRLAVNRFEPGLHFQGQPQDHSNKLLTTWENSYVQFPEETVRLEFDGKSKKV